MLPNSFPKETEISRPNVIAVDFGMSSLKVAYSLGNSRIKCLPLQYCDQSIIPNVLLISTNEHTGLTEAKIGDDAKTKYRQLEHNNTDHVYYQFNSEVNYLIILSILYTTINISL